MGHDIAPLTITRFTSCTWKELLYVSKIVLSLMVLCRECYRKCLFFPYDPGGYIICKCFGPNIYEEAYSFKKALCVTSYCKS